MNKKRVISMVVAGCLLMSGASFAVSNISANKLQVTTQSAASSQSVSVSSDNLIGQKNIAIENDYIKVNVKLPVLQGIKDKKAEEKLNKEIQAKMESEIAEIEKTAKEEFERSKKEKSEYLKSDVFADYSIKTKGNLLSFTIEKYFYTGGANGMPVTDFYNIDINTGKNIELKDLFKENTNFKAVIAKDIKDQISKENKAEINYYFDEKEKDVSKDYFKAIDNFKNFYIEDGSIFVVFDKYEIGAGALGQPEFRISNKVLENIVKDSSVIKNLGYQIESKQDIKDNKKINMPVVSNMSDSKLQELINKKIQENINSVDEKLFKTIKMTYSIEKMNEDKLSILINGIAEKDETHQIQIKDSVNFDLKNKKEITYENFIKKDENSQKALKSILDKKAKEMGIQEGFEAEGINVYLSSDKVVFYYMPLDHTATYFNEISVPAEAISAYIQ